MRTRLHPLPYRGILRNGLPTAGPGEQPAGHAHCKKKYAHSTICQLNLGGLLVTVENRSCKLKQQGQQYPALTTRRCMLDISMLANGFSPKTLSAPDCIGRQSQLAMLQFGYQRLSHIMRGLKQLCNRE